MDTPLGVQHVMPLELAREALEFTTLQCAERGWSVCFMQKKAICVLPNIHTAKADAEITGQKQEVSEEGTKILYGYSSERPQGVPQEFKVFARLDKQARYMKRNLARRSQLG